MLNIAVLKPKQKITLERPPGSADALWITHWVQTLQQVQTGAQNQAQSKSQKHPLCLVVTDQAADVQRLKHEIAWFAPHLQVLAFPDWETLPYEAFSAHHDLTSERLQTLWELSQGKVDILLTSASTALQKLSPSSYLAAYYFVFNKGDEFDLTALRAQLVHAGYNQVNQVLTCGEYAVRGGIIDLFPMGALTPYRVDLLGTHIDSIRVFDPDTQRSLYEVGEVKLLPAREFPCDKQAREQFRLRWREQFAGDPSRCPIYKDMGEGIIAAGMEYYLPLFFETTQTIFDYIGADAYCCLLGNVAEQMQSFWRDVRERHRFLSQDHMRPVLPPQSLFLSDEAFFIAAQNMPQYVLRKQQDPDDAAFAVLPDVVIDRRLSEPAAKLKKLMHTQGQQCLLLADRLGRQEVLNELLTQEGIDVERVRDWQQVLQLLQNGAARNTGVVWMTTSPLANGFTDKTLGLHLITETELFALVKSGRKQRKQQKASDIDQLLRSLAEINIGDPVVHVNHGVGRYQGLTQLEFGGEPQEFLQINYAKDAKLFVPVAQLELIQRYSGSEHEQAPLHTLGSSQWQKLKRAAAEQVYDTAAELLNIYAERALRTRTPYQLNEQDYARFCADFGFEETPDQRAAIDAVRFDMSNAKPMDRLVCGDVGFGKTEVAMRAAMIAIMSKKQVAIVAPTTLLSEQHYDTLRDRFANWPVNIAELSRFRSNKEVNAALAGIEKGSVDIVVGTHMLLSPRVKFAHLGLVIIDEEHRFGVRQKEVLKACRAQVDVLTLTATPIPRTLGISLEGIRDLSVITTAPERRLSIKTLLYEESPSIMREAILRELKRGGQVFVLHNEVKTIAARQQQIAELVPQARVGLAHGQMPERELERVMRDFVNLQHNVLVCSTIIETGINVPNANTIIITRAERFGLAQMHQLRGRVGRSHHQAYAYLLVNDLKLLSKQAHQRIEAICNTQELGSGFYLAMQDYEIRGAGEILGDAQSGNMTQVSYQIYQDMLNQAVKALKQGKKVDLLAPSQPVAEINLHTPALLPEDYCDDIHQRLAIYKKLSNAKTEGDIEAIHEELFDRLGTPPNATLRLLDTHRLRLIAQHYYIEKIDASEVAISLQFSPDHQLDPMSIIELMQSQNNIKPSANNRLLIKCAIADAAERVQYIQQRVRKLRIQQPAAA